MSGGEQFCALLPRPPFGLSLSKASLFLPPEEMEETGFDKLSPNGVEGEDGH
jgi:hypothetical protein